MGHRRQQEARAADLTPVTGCGTERMRHGAARDFLTMQDMARSDGVYLVPLSTFRSIKDQEALFFGTKAARMQAAGERARVSAPPGFSEHHTGYAVDIGDADVPSAHLVAHSFERTRAYAWLQRNAARYHFELSFPRGNEAGVDYEPWHFRWVGDADSLSTFYAR
jgi:D-alanyl-D-alanine carboxypeptidase